MWYKKGLILHPLSGGSDEWSGGDYGLYFYKKIIAKSFADSKKGITFAVLFGQKFFDTR